VIGEVDALASVLNAPEEADGLRGDRPNGQNEQPCGGSAPKLP
jgi:hypothetical protein